MRKRIDIPIIEVYHHGTIIGNKTVQLSPPFRFPESKMTPGIPGRVEVAEFSPHFAYSYTMEGIWLKSNK